MKKYLVLVMVMLLVLTAAGLPAVGQGPAQVTTGAQITGGGTPPEVWAKWELSDNDTSAPGIAIVPNPAVDPLDPTSGPTEICIYAVVYDPNGIQDITAVFGDVYHPDGSMKVQVHMGLETDDAVIQNAINEAVATGQMTPSEASSYITDIGKNMLQLWWGCFDYHVHQPSGTYTVDAWAVDAFGSQSVHVLNTFEVISIVVLALDFDTVDYGPILPLSWKWVGGNDVFSPGDGRATVWNRGNDPAMLSVHSSAMTGASQGKLIEEFDVELLGQQEVYFASEWVDLFGPLMPCTPVQIDFSIHAPVGTPADSYSGVLDIRIGHVP
jgi:hypothetical protein